MGSTSHNLEVLRMSLRSDGSDYRAGKTPGGAGARYTRPVRHPILLYDGVCGLCNRLVRFVLKRDRSALFQFASLQSEFAAQTVARHGAHSKHETVYVVLPDDPPKQGESLLQRSEAVTFVLSQLGGIWPAAAFLLRLIPHPIRDWGYTLVARHRYRIFGRYEACPLPTPETRSRFLDQ